MYPPSIGIGLWIPNGLWLLANGILLFSSPHDHQNLSMIFLHQLFQTNHRVWVVVISRVLFFYGASNLLKVNSLLIIYTSTGDVLPNYHNHLYCSHYLPHSNPMLHARLVMCQLWPEARSWAKPSQKKLGQARPWPVAWAGFWPGLGYRKAKAVGLSPSFCTLGIWLKFCVKEKLFSIFVKVFTLKTDLNWVSNMMWHSTRSVGVLISIKTYFLCSSSWFRIIMAWFHTSCIHKWIK